MKLMVTGAGGMTGAEVVRQAEANGWECAAFTRSGLDITHASAVEAAVATEKPDVVVNAAAFTAVDAAESAAADAMLVNAAGAGNVARAAQASGAALIHISTDYVFDGTGTVPYLPDDPVRPINVYGESKLAGEIAVRDECVRHVIVRTSWVYSHEGRNFVRAMLRAGAEMDEVRVVSDQQGSPTSAFDLASALLCASEAIVAGAGVAGTFHFCNSGITTWYEFANTIFRMRGGNAPRVTPIFTSEYPAPARRPAWSVLDTTSFEQVFGMTPRPWPRALRDTLGRVA